MIPAEFDYELAESGDHALQLLDQHGDEAKLLAGGHSLLPLMKLRLATPSMLIDIGRLQDMSYVRDDGDVIAIGALTRHEDRRGIRRARSSTARLSLTLPARSAIRRCATSERSVDRSRMVIPRLTFPR